MNANRFGEPSDIVAQLSELVAVWLWGGANRFGEPSDNVAQLAELVVIVLAQDIIVFFFSAGPATAGRQDRRGVDDSPGWHTGSHCGKESSAAKCP